MNQGGGDDSGGEGNGDSGGGGGSQPPITGGYSACALAGALLCGNPANAATGNKFQAENDYVGAPSTHLSLTRYYNSYGSAAGRFGIGWTSNYTASLSGPTSGVVTVTRGDGRIDSFTQSGSDWVSDPDVTSDLIPVMSGMTQIGWEVLRARRQHRKLQHVGRADLPHHARRARHDAQLHQRQPHHRHGAV